MISYIKDIALCIVIAMFLLFIGKVLNANFFDTILNSMLEVVFAVFAINIASTSLIAQLLNTISEQTGHPMEKSKKVLLVELRLQAIMIGVAILLIVTYHIDVNADSPLFQACDQIKYGSKVGLLTIYLYFIWITYDLGKSLFEVLNARFPKKK